MTDFKTIAGATELFKSVNGLGINNNIFMALKDTNREGMKYGLAGGLAAGIGIGIIINSKSANVVFGNKFDALLINQTENGLGIIPMHSKKIVLTTLKMENLEPDLENYLFLSNDVINEIKVKNFNIFNKKIQTVKIKVGEKNTLHLLARKSDKSLPYQEMNFDKFMNQYKK